MRARARSSTRVVLGAMVIAFLTLTLYRRVQKYVHGDTGAAVGTCGVLPEVTPCVRRISLSHSGTGKADIAEYVRKMKLSNPDFSVIDVGGAVSDWSRDFVDAVVDFNEPIGSQSPVKTFKVESLNEPTSWVELVQFVHQHGKYDFAICTHTLEDVAFPWFIAHMLPIIAKEGAISTPSTLAELWPQENAALTAYSFKGWIHHRWMFTFVKGVWTAIPKINLIEADPFFSSITSKDFAREFAELTFFWKDRVELKIIHGDYLGPNTGAVIDFYKEVLAQNDFMSFLECMNKKRSSVQGRITLDGPCKREEAKTTNSLYNMFSNNILTGTHGVESHIAPSSGLDAALERLTRDFNFHPAKILDVGCNVGGWSQHMRERFPSAYIVCVEANEEHRDLLESHPAPSQVIIALVSDTRKRVTYYSKSSAHTGNSVFRERTGHFDNDIREERRTAFPLDDLVAKLGPFQLVKMDIQGSELDALKGMRTLLKEVDVLQLELSVLSYNSDAPLALEVMSHLQDRFVLWDVVQFHHYKSDTLLQADVLFVRKDSEVWLRVDNVTGLHNSA